MIDADDSCCSSRNSSSIMCYSCRLGGRAAAVECDFGSTASRLKAYRQTLAVAVDEVYGGDPGWPTDRSSSEWWVSRGLRKCCLASVRSRCAFWPFAAHLVAFCRADSRRRRKSARSGWGDCIRWRWWHSVPCCKLQSRPPFADFEWNSRHINHGRTTAPEHGFLICHLRSHVRPCC